MVAGTLSSSTDTVLDDAASLLDQRDPADRTALMLAASEGHTNLIELFLDKGSVLESRDKEGMTALCWACVRGRLAAVQNLIDHGADVNTNDNTGRTPLDLAAFQVIFFKKNCTLIITQYQQKLYYLKIYLIFESMKSVIYKLNLTVLRTIQFPGQSKVGAIVARERSSGRARRSPRNATFGQSDRMSKHTRGTVFPTPWGEIRPGNLGDGRWKTRCSPHFIEQTPRRWKRPLQKEQTERGVA